MVGSVWRRVAVLLVPAAGLTVLGWRSGGYFPEQWGVLLLVFALMGIVGALVRRDLVLERREVVFVGLLAALAAWRLLSIAWSSGAGAPVREVELTLVYVAAAAAAFVCIARAEVERFAAGIALGVTIVTLGGLWEHLFPRGLRPYGYRLAGSLGYANAAGYLAALALVLALSAAAQGPRSRRLVAAALVVPLVATLYLSFSRGSIIAALAGILALVALSTQRGRMAATVAALGPAIALTVILVGREPALTGPAPLARMQSDGRRVALELVAVALLALPAVPVVDRAVARIRFGPRALRSLAAVLVVVLLVALVAVVVREGGPSEIARRATGAFSATPPRGSNDLNRRLLNASGNSRSAYWRVAASMVRREPILGEGAGSYERWWTQERPTESGARNAHNLYLETLAELGPLGLVLLLGVLTLPFLALRQGRPPHAVAAAAGMVVFAVHSALDWDWQIPELTLPALGLGAVLLIGARRPQAPPLGPRARALLVALLLPLLAVALVAHVGNGAAAKSERALENGDPSRALAQARRAERWAPWAALPLELRGEAETAVGNVTAARRNLRAAVANDDQSWRAWYDLSLVTTGREQERAIARASRLNPLGSEVAALRTLSQ